jgi:hypothetical protein
MRWGTYRTQYIATFILMVVLFIFMVMVSEFCFVSLSDVSYRIVTCGDKQTIFY